MAGRPPLPQDVRDAITADIQAGMARNAIRRKHHVSADVITRIAADLGVTFAGRQRTKTATEAKQADNAARRARLVDGYYAQAEKRLAMLDAPDWRTKIKGDRGAERFETIAFIPSGDWRDEQVAASHLLTSAAKLEAVDTDNGVTAVTSMLGRLCEALNVTTEPADA